MKNRITKRKLLATDCHRSTQMLDSLTSDRKSVSICVHPWPRTLTHCTFRYLAFNVFCLLLSSAGLRAETDFAKDVAPIFAEHCVRCHSDGNTKGDVSLSTFAHLDELGYVEAGDPEASYLIELVTSIDGVPPEMPKESDPLSDEEVQILRRWIREGVNWPSDVVIREKSKADATWWAYQPLQAARVAESTGNPKRERGPSPTTQQSDPSSLTLRVTKDISESDHLSQTIDDFIRSELAKHDLELNPPADRRTLIRRATYDLIGLPPTPEEVEAFVSDPDPNAYQKLIDRLLDSPHYGERWGRHWLDVVRFGESNGFERNFIINELWPFRDYVIRSLNEDKPFDQFIREHIVGDVFGKDNPDVAIGTAFLVAGPYDDVNNQDPVQAAQIRANTLDEIISATGSAFLGMTLGCARCHDHKFDPITQEDYYGLYATFSGIRHGRAPLVTAEERQQRNEKVKPLNAKQAELTKTIEALDLEILERARGKLDAYRKQWKRPSVDRTGTEERFDPVTAKFVRLTCEASDINPASKLFRVDEFEVWSVAQPTDATGNPKRKRETASTDTGNPKRKRETASTDTGNPKRKRGTASTDTGNPKRKRGTASTDTGNPKRKRGTASTDTGNPKRKRGTSGSTNNPSLTRRVNDVESSLTRRVTKGITDSENRSINVALQSNGGKASGQAREIKDFPDAYGPQHVNDGKTGARFISAGPYLTIELAKPAEIERIVFSSARGESTPEHQKFSFVAEYRIEVSLDGETWTEVANGSDRVPHEKLLRQPRRATGSVRTHLDYRLIQLETTPEETKRKSELQRQLNVVRRELAKIPPLRQAWIGTRNAGDAKGPFHVFLGGSPQKQGIEVVPASLSVFDLDQDSNPNRERGDLASDPAHANASGYQYRLTADAPEDQRRKSLAEWITHPDNPLTPRVLANRLWHYHFGTGIVDTPSDFGYMGGRPTHPELLDYLAIQLRDNGWRIKPLHRQIMLSDTYRQSSAFRAEAAKVDGDSRLLWRFPPRRLSSEEVRDTILMVAGKLRVIRSSKSHGNPKRQRGKEPSPPESKTDSSLLTLRVTTEADDSQGQSETLVPDGGPGFRLYEFMQDNVCTYVPLDQHGPDTYRRAVYHQNARASVVDLMTEFDQPDCTFSTPKRSETTTPLQALTMLNHSFSLDMAAALAERLQEELDSKREAQIRRVFQLCYSREPTTDELDDCRVLINEHGLRALCRVLLNTSELIYVQ